MQIDSVHLSGGKPEGAVASSLNGTNQRDALFEFIKHGDEAHQAWLRQAIDAFFYGSPRPPAK